MFSKVMKSVVLIGLILVPAIARAQLRSEHQTVVQGWLSLNRAFRLATERDCQNKEGLAAMRLEKESYQPYYAVADFNGDGREDFAVAFVNDTARARRFAIAIFNGSFALGRNVANFYRAGVDLSDGGLIVSGNRLLAGTFQSDNCVILSPRGRSYVMRSCV